jgi:hypothetical protein
MICWFELSLQQESLESGIWMARMALRRRKAGG